MTSSSEGARSMCMAAASTWGKGGGAFLTHFRPGDKVFLWCSFFPRVPSSLVSYQHVFELNVRKLVLDDALGSLAPQARARQNVGLVDAGGARGGGDVSRIEKRGGSKDNSAVTCVPRDDLGATAGNVGGEAHNALNLAHRVDHLVRGHAVIAGLL